MENRTGRTDESTRAQEVLQAGNKERSQLIAIQEPFVWPIRVDRTGARGSNRCDGIESLSFYPIASIDELLIAGRFLSQERVVDCAHTGSSLLK